MIISEEAEAYHEFEVVSDVEYRGSDADGKVLYEVTLAVIK